MSKYRITLGPSRMRQYFTVAGYCVLICSVWLWQDDVIWGQPLIQLAVTILLLLCLFKALRASPVTQTFSLSEQGEWIDLDAQTVYRITSASRVTPWLLWVQLQSMAGKKRHWCWIFRDAVADADYRRLARTLYRIQQEHLHDAV